MRFAKGSVIVAATLVFGIASTAPATAADPILASLVAEGYGVLTFPTDDRCPPHTAAVTVVSADLSSATLVAAAPTYTCSGHVVYRLTECSRQASAFVCGQAQRYVGVPILDSSFILEDSGHLRFEAYWLADNDVDYHTTSLEGFAVPVYAGLV